MLSRCLALLAPQTTPISSVVHMRTALKALFGLLAVGHIQAHPHSSSCTSNSASRPAATADADELFRDLSSAPTAIERFRRLLVECGALRTGEALEKLIVFDFNGPEPASGAMGGAVKAAVSTVSDI
jgi:hypothetical protein